ncbi:MAG: phospholipid transport system substrate-binding protein [Candidatus Pelagisphaera sp.]|jgi:phospholipid transport system substrate-binding protein
MSSNLIRSTFTSLAIFLWAIAPATADPFDAPKNALEATILELLEVLHADDSNLSYTAKREQIIEILNEDFSFDIIIQQALGRNWKKLDDKQKEQVTLLVTDLVLRTYTRELNNGPKPTMKFGKAKALTESKSKIEIASKVSLNGTEVNLSYRLANIKDRGWQVYDVLVEGVSMVSNYRKQFDEHFQRKSAADLIDLLKNKLKEVRS